MMTKPAAFAVSKLALRSAALALAALSSAAHAQSESGEGGPIPVSGAVPTLCSVGATDQNDNAFALGNLVDSTSGLLLTGLSAPPKTLIGAFCNSGSSITIEATPITAQTATGAPPTGFSNAVDFTAIASGWTFAPASFSTAAASNPEATQSRAVAFTGDIVVGIGAFQTAGGANLKIVADPIYQGSVTVTLAIAN